MLNTWLFLIAKKQKGLNSKTCIVMCLVIVSAVPSFFGDPGQFDSWGPGLGEGRKGKGSLMRVEKSEGGRKRPVWTRGQSGHLQQGRGKRQGRAGERQGNGNRDTDRHRAQAISSLWRISSVTERFQKQAELHRHRFRFRGKTPAPSLNYISVAVEQQSWDSGNTGKGGCWQA